MLPAPLSPAYPCPPALQSYDLVSPPCKALSIRSKEGET